VESVRNDYIRRYSNSFVNTDLESRLNQLATVLLLSKPEKTNLRLIEYEAKIRGIYHATLSDCVSQYHDDPMRAPPTIKNIAEILLHYQRKETDPARFAVDSVKALDDRVKAMNASVNNRYRNEQQAFLATHPHLNLTALPAPVSVPKKTFFQKLRGLFGSVFSYA